MSTPDGSADADVLEVAELRRQILADAPPPAIDEADIARLEADALDTIRRGRIVPRATEVRVRLTGKGIPNHDVPVHTAAQLLDAMQGAVTAVGSALNLQKRGKTPKKLDGAGRMGIRLATELRLRANISPGSVVFHLEGMREPEAKTAQLTSAGSDTLVDKAIVELFRILGEAQADEPDAIGNLANQLRDLGAMVASKLNVLAEQASASEIDLDLGHWSPSGARTAVQLQQRGASAIKEAADRNRVKAETSTIAGILHTVTDGEDLCRLTTDEGATLRLKVEPEVGMALGPLLGERVVAEIETTTKWFLASGRETRTHQLLNAAPRDRDPDSE